ncbi:MAG: putative alpha/beta-fold hydrolase [Lentimonas sp.]|jgi:predicted alpha/beta-fold hydrolase
MPLVQTSSYKAPFSFGNGHLQTVYPTFFRKVQPVTREHERITTPDDDFLDLYWAKKHSSQRLAILTHGLEGSVHSIYIQGMANALVQAGWNVLAWNFRSCSSTPNRQLIGYHGGAVDDLLTVLQHVRNKTTVQEIALVGFSLGGNILLKLLGDSGSAIDPRIRAAIALSVPCDLADSAKQMERLTNRFYMNRFLKKLRSKVREKQTRFPDKINDHGLDQMRTLREFDNVYTAPIHGFKDASDYWQNCSSCTRLETIAIPTLLINALDDPFLAKSCYPIEQAKNNPMLHLETPENGGHIGFVSFGNNNTYWSESRTIEFLNEAIRS